MAAKKWNPLLGLLWKNFRLRVKHPVAWIFEILSPVLFCLLLILFAIASKRVNKPVCDIKAKALPTASGMLFLQTLLCAASNKCDDEENASFGSFNSSLLSTVGEALKQKYNIKSRRSKNLDLNKWAKDFYVIDSMIEAIDNENKKWQLLYNTLLRSNIYSGNRYLNLTLGCKAGLTTHLHSLGLRCPVELISDPPYIFSAIENSNIKKLIRIKRNIHRTGVLNSFIRIVTDEDHSLTNFINLFFCGPNMDSIEDQLTQVASELASKETKEDPDMSKYCNELVANLEKSRYKLILQFFKPLIFGKVVYTPDAPVINRIMERFGESFKKVKDLLDALKSAKKEWTDLRAWKLGEIFNKYKNEEKFLREAVKTKTGRTIMRPYEDEIDDGSGEKALKHKIEKFQKILNKTEESYNNYLRETGAEATVSALISALECFDFNKVIAVESEGEALEKAKKFLRKDRLWGYIIFTNVPSGAEKLPPSVTYKMRVAPDRSPDTLYKNKVVNKTGVVNDPIKDLKEIEGGTVYLQNLIEGELIREITGRKDIPGIYLNQLPYPCYQQDLFLESGFGLLKTFIIFSFTVPYCLIVKRIVIEKEILFKEVLRVFGVTNAHHWIAFFIDAFITGLISIILLCVILKILFGYFTLFFLFLLAALISIIALAFLVSTFFTKSSYCTMLAFCIYFFLVVFDSLLSQTGNPTGQVFLCFISISAITYAFTWMENVRLSNLPLTVEFINYAPDRGSPLTLLLIIFMLLIDGVIYILLAIYLENVISTKAVRKPWNYCFKASYWKNCCKTTVPTVEEYSVPENTSQRKKVESKNFEAEPEGTIGIEVLNVSKEFGKSKNKISAVNNLSINFYENQITSFLGHNGAGKSTTVLMMTGVIAPTSGTIRIYGVDLRKNPGLALKDVGICLQENVFLGELSVRDHLVLIGKLKGLDKKEIKRNLDELLESFELTSRASQPVKHLSGGWKRKVCIAMAFMGGSRTIFLDEPTAGIDPFARRSVWNVLVKLKKDRTIVLITHHLDEAEILGDRIAIIASGELKCCGSASFLKSNLDKGYILTIDTTVRPERTPPGKGKDGKKRLSSQAQEMLSTVKSVIPGAEMEEERGCEFIFSLPQKQSSYDLNRLFEALDRNKKKMNINSYGVSAVSLEEVFMKVLKADEVGETNKNNAKRSASQKSVREPTDGKKSQDSKSVKQTQQSMNNEMKKLREKEKFRARRLFWNHLFALWIKRGQRCKRHYIFLLIQILLPLTYALLSLLSVLLVSPELPLLRVDVSDYDSSVLFYTNNIPANPHLASYEDALLGPYGLGTKCVLSPKKCSLKSIPKGSMVAEGETIASNNCTCEDGTLTCSGNATAEPPEAEMSTGHKLFNMSGLDLHNWLIATEFKYSIERIGGISFGHVSPFTGVSVADFLNLFPGKGLLKTLEKYISGGPKEIDPKAFTSDIMAGINDDYGGKLFKDKDSADNIIVWFNSKDKIASMALINGVSNLVLRASLPNGTDPSIYSIQLVVHPFKTRLSNLAASRKQISLMLVMSLIQSLAFLFALIIIYLVEERFSGMKHLAFISGINPILYWCAYFLWDIVIFSIYFVLLLVLLVIFSITSFCGLNTLPVFTALLYSYAVTALIFLYLMSNFFSRNSSAVVFVFVWIAVVGVFVFLICSFLFGTSYEWITKILMLIPECCLGLCLLNLTKFGNEALTSLDEIKIDYFQWDTTTQYIIRILINGGVYLILLVLLELRNIQPFGIITKLFMGLKLLLRKPSKKVQDDEDVDAEKDRVRSNKAKEEGDLLIIKNLTKIYCGQQHPAANHVYVGVKRGECLGLLGMNGAGKTTIFKMITGTTSPTVGDATIAGYSITYSPIKSRILMGYCPQAHALDPYLTPVEHLSFFCRIRGFDKKRRNKETDTLIELLNLGSHKTKISKTLSGGNQRKLNAAIALLTEPELILLDEPTAGMDVLARRFLWSRLLDVLQDGRCLVLTTHSMEECQALATQVCIMFKGRFLCFGTSQHLKNKFNDGYRISLRLVNADNYKDVINYLNDNLAGYTIVSVHVLHVKIKLHPDASLGKAVNVLGDLKRKQWIEDYSLNQTTLETVFLNMIGEVDRTKVFQKSCCSC